ncbi:MULTISPECIES: Holliday junction branch migration DNA helicase RuvB [unclassified Mycoplasma]|uniref:Holliday junction branch migration DNA helicase RuvB n=1 Tax=unclassified Mycoplasma TaxID=2683645 RepID=UPI00197C8A61|nr:MULTISPECIES: Holliday junction branch migration DNA helicase RuvB [unclassified Mycoplasma]MBN4084534.1 Holliday junction branch migration DNA helicase RuvB [Mycoplasma sp. CSL10166]MBU4693012.1 Holliday junction branch migration DNA helicase RuvB [Mycoplasma sp. CSL7491-lung]
MKIRELRPNNFNDFIGQNNLKKTLDAMVESSTKQNIPLPHVLLYGPPGMGKTTLASIIATKMNKKIHFIQGANLEKKSDIINVLSVINSGDIVFIDEIHSINKSIVEFLYNAMEDFVFDLIIGVDGNSKAIRMKVKPFTLIGATTKLNYIPQPFKDRFGYIGRLVNYNNDDIFKILRKTSKKLNIVVDDILLKEIAEYSRGTPRIANHLIQRINDFAITINNGQINIKIVKKALKHLELYKYGLTKEHIHYLNILRDGFDEKPVSLNTISSLLSHEKQDILNEIEPILLYLKLIKKNSRGRQITSEGIDYLIKLNLSY